MQNIKGGRWNTLAKKQARAGKQSPVTVTGDPREIGKVLLAYEIVKQLKLLGMLSDKKEGFYIIALADIIKKYQVTPKDASGTYKL